MHTAILGSIVLGFVAGLIVMLVNKPRWEKNMPGVILTYFWMVVLTVLAIFTAWFGANFPAADWASALTFFGLGLMITGPSIDRAMANRKEKRLAAVR